MARKSGKKDELIKCEYCGEMYSTTYKHCPFCNEDGTSDWVEPEEDDYEEERSRGGKRLAAAGSGGSYYDPPQKGSGRGGRGRRNISPWSIVGVIVSLVLIIAAICIVVSIFRSITGRGKKPTPTPTPSTIESQEPTPTPTDPDEPDPTPTVEVTVPPVANKPTSFTLNASDLTFFNPGEVYDLKVKLVPEDAEADVVWSSSDPNVASVSWNGRVTAISKGTVTITATIEGVGEQKCIFRCRFEGTATPSTSNSGNANSSGLTLSREDFTLFYVGEYYKILVSGTDSAVTWTSSNEAVATVSSNGTVTAVSKGTCTITATVDGVTLKCIVRCNWST